MEKTFTINISAAAVAWYAAIVSTISVLVSGYVAWRDRTRLRITATANMRISTSVGSYSDKALYIIVEVANIGRRPIVLTQLAIRQTNPKQYLVVVGDWIPKSKIDEGERATRLCVQDDYDLKSLSHAIVTDATGRKWKTQLKLAK